MKTWTDRIINICVTVALAIGAYYFSQINKSLDRLTLEVTELRKEVQHVSDTTPSKDAFHQLDTRVTTLEVLIREHLSQPSVYK